MGTRSGAAAAAFIAMLAGDVVKAPAQAGEKPDGAFGRSQLSQLLTVEGRTGSRACEVAGTALRRELMDGGVSPARQALVSRMLEICTPTWGGKGRAPANHQDAAVTMMLQYLRETKPGTHDPRCVTALSTFVKKAGLLDRKEMPAGPVVRVAAEAEQACGVENGLTDEGRRALSDLMDPMGGR